MPQVALTYPRLSTSRASEIVGELLQGTRGTEPAPDFSIGAAAYRPTSALARADEWHLREVRSAILEIGKSAGYRSGRVNESSPKAEERKAFDAALPGTLHNVLRMTPAEAASREVWAFLTLCVVPDIARWRYPKVPQKDGSFNNHYERYMGGPRNILRQSWRRGYALGKHRAIFDEDGFEAIRGRRMFDNLPYAREYSLELEHRLKTTKASQRTLTRQTCMLLQRWSSSFALDFMSSEQRRSLIAQAFDETERALAEEEGTSPDIEKFFGLVPIAIQDAGLYSAEEIMDIRQQIDEYTSSLIGDLPRANKIRENLWMMLDAWDELDDLSQRVATCAIRYFLQSDDEIPDYAPGGLSDDEEISIEARRIIEERRRAPDDHPA